ncbi:DUF2332 domain-containing protein [Rugosimonospora africana]|uniref:DUF2332 domain-containing protein n=1 Tax=Rugosimonospora africana TaxID=556532 RepID=A0A8J3VNX9_9ACTN|nr:DUF2332 domain-containing protein [Rugosimonospora africana]GIH13629.1 hypothetical protein Raf01_18010 [Rugosimonospora africana]
MSDNVVDQLLGMFRSIREREFTGSSEVYTRLSDAVEQAPGLAEPLLAAPPEQRRPLLYFAATQYLLRTSAHGHPLAGYLPTLGGTRAPDPGLVPAFAAFVRAYGGDLAALCASRNTQTNEPLRSALLRPAFARAGRLLGDRPVSLVELGTSAGLLLLSDRYGYRYRGRRYGRADAPEALVMDCEVRGGQPADLDREPVVADRVGLDLAPVDAGDPASVDWLRSCVWPEHTERLARLDAALAEAVRAAPRLIAGDLVAGLPAVLSDVDAVPLVFASHALIYLPDAARAELVATLAETGRRRDLVVVLNESSACGLELFARVAPRATEGEASRSNGGPGKDGPAPRAACTLTMVVWLDGHPTVTELATTDPHARWLHWRIEDHPYRPVG